MFKKCMLIITIRKDYRMEDAYLAVVPHSHSSAAFAGSVVLVVVVAEEEEVDPA